MQRTVLLVLSAALVATPCVSQEMALELRAGRTTLEKGEGGAAGLAVAPSITWQGASAAAGAGGELLLSSAGEIAGAGGLGFRLRRGGAGAGVELAVDASARGTGTGALAVGFRAAPMVGFAGGTWSVVAGPHAGVLATKPGAEENPPAPWPPLGSRDAAPLEARMVYGLVAVGAAGDGPVLVSGTIRNSRAGELHWTDVQGRAVLESSRFALGVQAGWRAGDLSEEWAVVDGAIRLTPAASVVANVGRFSADPLEGRVPGTRAEIGIRLSTGSPFRAAAPAAPAPVAASAGPIRLVVRAEPGSTVELVADWTGWRAVPVDEIEPGVYRITPALPPGKHRFAFLVDGVWTLPDGYPTEANDYGDRHAVVRVTDS